MNPLHALLHYFKYFIIVLSPTLWASELHLHSVFPTFVLYFTSHIYIYIYIYIYICYLSYPTPSWFNSLTD